MLPTPLKFKQLSEDKTDTNFTMFFSSIQKSSSCPICGNNSRRIHSHYSRRLADLPISGKIVHFKLSVRRFFCLNQACIRKIFTERFAVEIQPYARRLERCKEVLRNVGFEVGGNKGALISRIVGSPVSSSTILRFIQEVEIKEAATTSGVIGVDDWAYKKGRSYGTIIVDLKRREVIDLLPDREAETLKLWLLKHPEVHTVSRDRASAYSKGIREGSEGAIEVADRYHLQINLRNAFEKVLYKHNSALKEAFIRFSRPGDNKHVLDVERPKAKVKSKPNSERELKFEKAKELHRQGYGIKTIAKMLQAGRHTIRKYIQHDEFPQRQEPAIIRGSTNFHSFTEYLLKFYGEHDYLTLYTHIRNNGFNGKYTQFCANMNRYIKSVAPDPFLPKLAPIKSWSTSKLSFMIFQPEDLLRKTDQAFLRFLYNEVPQIKAATEMAIAFKNLFKDKEQGSLKEWLTEALLPESELRSFARGVKHDYKAIDQAVISPISNGQVEGQVNKLKNIKRMMYGRASFPLLKKMVLHRSIVHQK